MVNSLVKKLSAGQHPITLGHRGQKVEELQERIKNGFVHVKFTQTQGGTELGINIDKDKTNLKEADFIEGKGKIHLEGVTTLNYEKVRCIADIDLSTMEGNGSLVLL